MNFIDKAVRDKAHMSPDDFLQAMADIYKEPEVWKILDKYPQFIQDVIYIIDYDTILQMEGLDSFVCDKEENVDHTITALNNCGAANEANILIDAKNFSLNDDLEEDDYYEKISALEKETALYNDDKYEVFWDCVRRYIEMNY